MFGSKDGVQSIEMKWRNLRIYPKGSNMPRKRPETPLAKNLSTLLKRNKIGVREAARIAGFHHQQLLVGVVVQLQTST